MSSRPCANFFFQYDANDANVSYNPVEGLDTETLPADDFNETLDFFDENSLHHVDFYSDDDTITIYGRTNDDFEVPESANENAGFSVCSVDSLNSSESFMSTNSSIFDQKSADSNVLPKSFLQLRGLLWEI